MSNFKEDLLDFRFAKGKHLVPETEFLKSLWRVIVDGKQSITIVADYDVDGFLSGIQLEQYLSVLSSRAGKNTEINLQFSSRFDGYTFPKEKFDKLVKQGSCVVFLDTGGSYPYLKKDTKNVIVVDHHPKIDEIKDYDYIFNPNKDGLVSTSTGAFLYESIEEFEEDFCSNFSGEKKHKLLPYLKALAAITLVSDMAAKTVENYQFIKEGLAIIDDLRDKFEWANLLPESPTSNDLSFNLINYINSLSRLNINLEKVAPIFELKSTASGKISKQ